MLFIMLLICQFIYAMHIKFKILQIFVNNITILSVRVRKKDATQSDVIKLGDGPHYIQDSGVLEKPCAASGDKLLTIREFGQDSGRKRKNDEDLCSHNDNAIHTGSTSKSKKKRKHSDEIQGSKYFFIFLV